MSASSKTALVKDDHGKFLLPKEKIELNWIVSDKSKPMADVEKFEFLKKYCDIFRNSQIFPLFENSDFRLVIRISHLIFFENHRTFLLIDCFLSWQPIRKWLRTIFLTNKIIYFFKFTPIYPNFNPKENITRIKKVF